MNRPLRVGFLGPAGTFTEEALRSSAAGDVALEEIPFASEYETVMAVQDRVREVGTIFGLDGKLDVEARLLSQGQKKLLDIASAFALAPEVILLDEPTSGVSTGDKHGIMKTLIDAAKRARIKAIILVEHDMDLVAEYSSRIVALQGGKVLADLPPSAFFSDPDIAAAVVGKLFGKSRKPH